MRKVYSILVGLFLVGIYLSFFNSPVQYLDDDCLYSIDGEVCKRGFTFIAPTKEFYIAPISSTKPLVFSKTYQENINLTFTISHLTAEQVKNVYEHYNSYSFGKNEQRPPIEKWFRYYYEESITDSDESLSIVASIIRNTGTTEIEKQKAEQSFREKGIELKITQN